ncbi:MAG: hypothetical protein JSW73_03250 [Candidatus Woesearchaeota archaeon]|nr:MAG: hypothetical protein JSW73_03250 [Candidatus Woesearchaeota archaeon]
MKWKFEDSKLEKVVDRTVIRLYGIFTDPTDTTLLARRGDSRGIEPTKRIIEILPLDGKITNLEKYKDYIVPSFEELEETDEYITFQALKEKFRIYYQPQK